MDFEVRMIRVKECRRYRTDVKLAVRVADDSPKKEKNVITFLYIDLILSISFSLPPPPSLPPSLSLFYSSLSFSFPLILTHTLSLLPSGFSLTSCLLTLMFAKHSLPPLSPHREARPSHDSCLPSHIFGWVRACVCVCACVCVSLCVLCVCIIILILISYW